MANERYVLMTVECPRCKTNQKVHVAITTGGAEESEEKILCLNCNRSFKVTLPDKIIRGPYPV
jgi:transposase-like protein